MRTNIVGYIDLFYPSNEGVFIMPKKAFFELKLPKLKLFTKFPDFTSRLALGIGIVGLVILLISLAPMVFYEIDSLTGGVSAFEVLKRPFVGFGSIKKTEATTEPEVVYQPAVDSLLPKENRLKISAIGVDTKIGEASEENYEKVLKEGVWRVSDFGTPYGRGNPTIFVAHRYGYIAWSNILRKKSSFYNLPRLKAGDTLEVIWGQRKYVYEVYAGNEGEEITDYRADLILYTCKSLTSPVRVFRYARLLEI